MTRPLAIAAVVAIALMIAPAPDAAGAASVDSTQASASTAARPAAVTPSVSTRATTPVSGAVRGTARAAGRATSTAGAPKPGPRRLDEIHIEGEIPVPQVLFITARDQRRFMEFHHRRYLRTSRELGEATAFPSRIAVVRPQPATAPAADAGTSP